METVGVLYGVGMGPGDPELVTLKALRVMRACDVLVLPEEDKAKCRAFQIARAACPELEEKEALCLPFPMTRDGARRDAVLEENWAGLKAQLEAGKDLAFLTIGDPGVYSTYSYMALRAARDGCRTVTVPGVASFTACAASLNMPLRALVPLEKAGLVKVSAVSDCGTGELCFSGAAALPEDAPYMTTVIVKPLET